MVLSYIAGPIIGAIIGYCTNYIAVKMLFFPKKEVRIGGKRVPFTPGVIPKGKDRLALAVGDVVGNKLVTAEDIESKLINEEVGKQLAGSLAQKMALSFREGFSQMIGISEEKYLDNKEKIVSAVSDLAADTVANMDMGEFLMQRGTPLLLESVNNPMLAMFLTPELIESIIGPMGDRLKETIIEEKDDIIRPLVQEKIEQVEETRLVDFAKSINFSEEEIEEALAAVILNIMKGSIGGVIEQIDVEGIVRDKIRSMSVDDMENLVLKVLKKELDAIVNLGALIGFIIGLLMIWF